MDQPRRATTAADPDDFSLPRITVAVLDGRHRGALAYALQSALRRPATIVVVHPRLDVPPDPTVPLGVREVDGPVGDSLVAATTSSDVLVVEVTDRVTDRLTDPRLVQLRRQTECLLIEVDSDGQVVRASGPIRGMIDDRAADPVTAVGHLVVVGVDGSPEGDAVVDWAAREAMSRGAVLRLVAAYPNGSSPVPAESALTAASGRTTGVVVEGVLVRGEPVGVLVDQSEGADLLVVGGHRTSGLIHSAMGGVGDSCARLADCPVVIVPSRRAPGPAQAGTDHATRVPPPAA